MLAVRSMVLTCLICAPLLAQPAVTEEVFTPDHESAIARGLAYLVRQQQADGSILNRDPNSPDNAPRFNGPPVALTGISLMAFLSAGRVPDEGKHGLAVRNAVEFLLKSAPDDGYFGKVDGGRMVGHAVVTLALSEVYGMESDAKQRRRLRVVLERSVKVLLAAQNTRKDPPFAGGWRHDPVGGDSDLLTTGWCALALRAANNAGVEVPRQSADRAAAFVLKCWKNEKGGFSNQPANNDVTIAATAVGVLSLQLLDRPDRSEATRGIAWLIEHHADNDNDHPCYARYGAALAAFQAGGEIWPKIWNRIQAVILQRQQREKDGSWPPGRSANEPGKVYSTAMSVMTLSLPLRLLPANQK